MTFSWPAGFDRIPSEDWAHSPLGELAQKYDTVETHGWYRNLDRTVEDLTNWVNPGCVFLDYSGGTGILTDRFLQANSAFDGGILIVDSSPKFLRLAVEKLAHDSRVAFRLIRYLRDEKRIQLPQEVIEPPLLERGFDGIVSTNAVHLYYGLEATLTSWFDLLKPQGRAFVQSGNIGLDPLPENAWIIDATVEAIHLASIKLVMSSDRWKSYRSLLQDGDRMEQYDRLREKFFLPVRPLAYYLESLEAVGFQILDVSHERIVAKVEEWYEFLSAYHEGVLGWVGGSERIEGTPPTEQSVADRLELMRLAMDDVFESARQFDAMWTYITAAKAFPPAPHPVNHLCSFVFQQK